MKEMIRDPGQCLYLSSAVPFPMKFFGDRINNTVFIQLPIGCPKQQRSHSEIEKETSFPSFAITHI
jgi:hypothetical protein